MTRIFFFRVPAIGISNAMTGTAHCSAQQHTAAHKRRAAHSAQHTVANSSAEQHGKLRVARPVQANCLLRKPRSLILHDAEALSAHSSAQLTSRATHAHPTSPRSTGFCAIWDCISSSSSSQQRTAAHIAQQRTAAHSTQQRTAAQSSTVAISGYFGAATPRGYYVCPLDQECQYVD